jgi:hypothetical protein
LKVRLLYRYLFLLWGFIAYAQQPTYYRLGEEALAEVDLYSIIQTEDGIIWMTSDQGVYKYDGYFFKNIKSQSTKSHSLFGIKTDRKGDLFCANFHGEIFKIEEDSLRLFYQIPDSLLSTIIHFNFDNQNNLIFSTRGYYVLDEDMLPKHVFCENGSNPMVFTKDEQLVLINRNAKEFAYYKDGKINEIEKVNFVTNSPFRQQEKIYFGNYSTQKPDIFQYENKKWQKIPFENRKILEQKDRVGFSVVTDSILSFSFGTRGIFFYNNQGKLKYGSQKLFSKFRISGVLQDQEASIWLITLGKGILIIPNPEMIDFNNHPLLKDADLKTMSVDDKSNVFLGSLEGVLSKISKDQVEIVNKTEVEIQYVKYNPEGDFLVNNREIFTDEGHTIKIKDVSAVKDIFMQSADTFYMASSVGVFEIVFDKKKKKTSQKVIFRGRTKAVAYDVLNKQIWAGTAKGLKIIKNHSIKEVRYNNQVISATDFAFYQGKTWVATLQHGILIFENDKFIKKHISAEDYQTVHQLKYKDSKLYYATDQGMVIDDLRINERVVLDKTDGLLASRITDFELGKENIWFLFSKGVQKIPYQRILRKSKKPKVFLEKILVNKTLLNKTSKDIFDYTQNEWEFHFKSIAYRHRGTMKYHYRLVGLDSLWKVRSFENNYINFQSLPYGAFTFEVKAENEKNRSSEVAQFSFEILPPFWLSWWFYALIIVLVFLIIVTYFYIRLQIIKKRLTLEKQLKVSEITAIKAQMHPHFVFNALNSIQDLIMQKDIRSSNIYLGKFADLMRKTLEFSGKNFICLSEELEMLNLYLELEKLRFGEELEAGIQNEISTEERAQLEVPSMLIQPYVENAIKHGLLHKKGQKILRIYFYKEEERLVCEIIDNGIGRKKSQEIQERRAKSYQSFSTQANKKRLNLIQESSSIRISLAIIDLEENGKASGTKVVLKFSNPQ